MSRTKFRFSDRIRSRQTSSTPFEYVLEDTGLCVNIYIIYYNVNTFVVIAISNDLHTQVVGARRKTRDFSTCNKIIFVVSNKSRSYGDNNL